MLSVSDSSFLVTGGTGSFGRAMVHRLLQGLARRVVVLSRDEKKQHDLLERFGDSRLECLIGDVRDYERVRAAMRGIDYVFSAAALKQVPSCENCPIEAVKTNVLGTENVCQAAIASGVKAVCVLSTDKAVEPINAMGMSKALAEKVMASHAAGKRRGDHLTTFVAVRYGNVMGSRGSVLEVWRNAETIRVTDGHMTRFCMSMGEAIELVLTALDANDEQAGCTFVHPAKVSTIWQLAHAFQETLPMEMREIEVIGVRPGEKAHEVLIAEHEVPRTTIHDGHFCIWPTSPDPALQKLGNIYSSDTAEKESDSELIRRVKNALIEIRE